MFAVLLTIAVAVVIIAGALKMIPVGATIFLSIFLGILAVISWKSTDVYSAYQDSRYKQRHEELRSKLLKSPHPLIPNESIKLMALFNRDGKYYKLVEDKEFKEIKFNTNVISPEGKEIRQDLILHLSDNKENYLVCDADRSFCKSYATLQEVVNDMGLLDWIKVPWNNENWYDSRIAMAEFEGRKI